MNGKRTILYAVIASCIIGIAAVGFFIFRYVPVNENFSELYFESQEQLPDKIGVGEEESFSFTVVSHEDDEASYHYLVGFEDEIIEEEAFVLLPQGKKTIETKFTPGKSSIGFVDSKTELYTSRFELDNIVGFIYRGVEAEKPVTIFQSENNKIVLPINFPYSGDTESSILLEIDPDSKDTFQFSHSEKYYVSGEGEEIKSTVIFPLTPLGYNIIEEEQTITNDYGKITVVREVVESEYRYEKKKISVELSVNGKEYGIHFWTIVEESSMGE